MQAATPPEAEVLDRRLDALLPRVRITELLFEVAERTGFLAAFRDVRSGKQHDKPPAVLAAILAVGTNLGVERMANASQGVTYAQLAWTQNWYISPENYEAAIAQIVREHHRLPFTRNWGEGVSASSDGQFFRTGRIRSGAAEINAKYGHEPGIKIYSHLSDHFASFSSRIMSATASEAPANCRCRNCTPIPAVHPITCLAFATCWSSASCRACATWPIGAWARLRPAQPIRASNVCLVRR